MRATLRLISLSLILALSGCAVGVKSDPEKYSIDPKQTAQLKKSQSVSLVNGYKDESMARFKIGMNTIEIERRQLTETAIAMLRRALEKQGISVVPGAPKSIVLQARPQGIMFQYFRYTGRVVLAARFGDGREASIPQENLSPMGWNNAFDGAVLFALNDLLEHEYFVAYMNQ